MTPVFDVDELVADCIAARAETEPRLAVRDTLVRVLARPDDIAAAPKPSEAGITLLHHAPDLTIIHVVWAPGMRLFPHNHLMWAVIGIYVGQEDNTFYRRTGPGARTIDESGGKELTVGDVLLLGDDIIHAVANPTRNSPAPFTSTAATSSIILGVSGGRARVRSVRTTWTTSTRSSPRPTVCGASAPRRHLVRNDRCSFVVIAARRMRRIRRDVQIAVSHHVIAACRLRSLGTAIRKTATTGGL